MGEMGDVAVCEPNGSVCFQVYVLYCISRAVPLLIIWLFNCYSMKCQKIEKYHKP